MNVIAITTFSNGDLLYIYLENLAADRKVKDYKIRLFTEPGFDRDIEKAIECFSFLNIDLKVRNRHPRCPLVGFHNILETYRDAAELTDKYCVIGEDDLLPVKGALSFYDEVYNKFLSKYDRIFAFGHKIRAENEKLGNPNILIGDNQLPSPACISKEVIEKYILPHLTDELYDNPPLYYQKHFPNFRVPAWEAMHHDVFLERIIDKNKMFGLKCDHAFSGHVGLRGINCKGEAPKGSFMERVEQYKELIQDGDKLRSLSSSPEDLVVADWGGAKWNNLELDLDRNKAKASTWHYDKENLFKKYIDENI